jgi:surface polysaccharide O-acyltransferase-like enzyme
MSTTKKINKLAGQPINHTLNKRLLWPDVVRIIAIYLVVQAHTEYTVNSFSATMFFDKLNVLGVPLFVLLSGALLLGKQESYKIFFRKRCMKVLLPWVVWTLLYMAYFFNLHHSQVMSDFFTSGSSLFSQWFRFFFRTFMSSLWFLPLIFSIYLLTPVLRIIVKYAMGLDYLYVLILWFIFMSVMPYLVISPLFTFWEPTLVYAPIQYSGYFLLGYIVIKHEIFKKLSLPILFLISILPFWVTLLPLRSAYIQHFTGGYLLPGTVIASLFLFYFFYAASNKIDAYITPLMRKIITMVGRASFGVYIINEMYIDYFRPDITRVLAVVHSDLFIALVSFLLLSIIVIILQRIPILKYIVP